MRPVIILEAPKGRKPVNKRGLYPSSFRYHLQTKRNSFSGTLDDFRVYERSLTTDEVDSLYREGGLNWMTHDYSWWMIDRFEKSTLDTVWMVDIQQGSVGMDTNTVVEGARSLRIQDCSSSSTTSAFLTYAFPKPMSVGKAD